MVGQTLFCQGGRLCTNLAKTSGSGTTLRGYPRGCDVGGGKLTPFESFKPLYATPCFLSIAN